MTSSLQRRVTAVFAVLLAAAALSILSVSIARADPLTRPVAATAATSGPVTPPAGTEGRGGVTLLTVTPPAGTAGRGGVALAPFTAAGTSAAARVAVVASGRAMPLLAGRGRIGVPLSSAPANGGWIALGIAVVTLLGGAVLWWASARRDRAAARLASVSRIDPVVDSSDAVSQEWERKAA